jgi:hypothetical protein
MIFFGIHGAQRCKARKADWSRGRSPPFTDNKEAGYAGACHRAAPCADPVGLQPALGSISRAPDAGLPVAMTARWITSPLLTLAINLCALDIRLRNVIVFADVGYALLL